MLLEVNKIKSKEATDSNKFITLDSVASIFVGKPNEILNKHLGKIENGKFYQFYSSGRFCMTEMIFHLLNQTGPVHLLCGTFSVSMESVDSLVKAHLKGAILSLSFVIDPRMKINKAKPLQMIKANFPVVFSPWHAKVTTMENEDWNISIVSSQNMTQNPKIERGCIFTDKETFNFDKNMLLHELQRKGIRND